MIAFLLYTIRLLHYSATMAAFGGSLFRLIAAEQAIDRRLRPAIIAASLLSLASAGLWLALEAGSMSDDPAACFDPATIRLVLTQTMFGNLWQVRLPLGLVLVIASLGRRWWPVAMLAALSLLLLAGEGHGRIGRGQIGQIHLAAQATHLLAAGAWLGGLLPLALVLRDSSIASAQARIAVARFSALGYLAVSLVFLTGAINTEVLSGNAYHVSSGWTVTLGIKLIFFAAMLGLAVMNRTRLVPRWGRDPDGTRAALWRTVVIEGLLALLVLAAASVLGTLQPPQS